jgi:hypothetical protein
MKYCNNLSTFIFAFIGSLLLYAGYRSQQKPESEDSKPFLPFLAIFIIIALFYRYFFCSKIHTTTDLFEMIVF